MDEEGHPYIKDERLCMHCHHCLALCPTGAISVDGHNPDASRRILNAWPQPEQLENLIKGRRSVRQYRPENGIVRGAPHFVLVGNAKDAPCQEQDPLIYLSYMELYAQSLGLGTTWCGLLYWCLQLMLPELLPELGLPETHSFQYAMLLGEPAIRYARTVEYGPATVHRIQWK